MKKILGLTVLAIGLGLLPSCQSGPKRLTRSWDDWVNQKYTTNAWLRGALLQDVLPVYGIVGLVMALGDIIVLNPYYFWSEDAWDNKGTGFNHKNPVGAERSVADVFENM